MNYNAQVEAVSELQKKIRALGKTKVMTSGQADWLLEKVPAVLETIRRAEMQGKALEEIFKCANGHRECGGCDAIAKLIEDMK